MTIDNDGPLYLGLDLSTQQLKGIIINSDLQVHTTCVVDFDADLRTTYPDIEQGVCTSTKHPTRGPEIYSPVAMWLDAVDLLFDRIYSLDKTLVNRIKAVSGAGMQHGTVFWSLEAEDCLSRQDAEKGSLSSQLKPAFSRAFSPNWQDASTQEECEAFDTALDGAADTLAYVTGSKAHHRFSGPQILRWHQENPADWDNTLRISLVSSFLASVLAGKVTPLDVSDVCGMNLWDVRKRDWNEQLLALAAGRHGAEALRRKLGHVLSHDASNQSVGSISQYFVQKYNFNPACSVVNCTGDNPSTMLALPLRAGDAIVSLGTSTTFLMSTPIWRPDPVYHFMDHPTTPDLYMFMLCYKNGGLARERVRDEINQSKNIESRSWNAFNEMVGLCPPLARRLPSDPMRMGLFFPRPEIVPNVRAGQWRYDYNASVSGGTLTAVPSSPHDSDARTILESQFLSLRLRSKNLVEPVTLPDGTSPPAQPRRIYLVGGGSNNPVIAEICGQVLGGAEGVYRLDVGGNACALGAAHKAAWASEHRGDEAFEDFVKARWDEENFVRKIDCGYRSDLFELYGRALSGFEAMEAEVISREPND